MTELMVATVILSIGILGLFGAFKYIARSTLISRATSMATNLGQERIESLKNLSYYALQITTAAATHPTGGFLYDTVNYPVETIAIGGITFTRYTFVGMAEMTGSDISTVTFTYPDTGLKQITVDIVWTEAAREKRWTLRNLLENPNINPLDSTLTGTVTNSAGGFVASAVVVVEQNADWGATTDASGAYTFSVYHGTYTIRASSTGFSDGVSSSLTAAKGTPTAVPAIALTPIATGYISGTAWYNTYPVISQVVVSTLTQVGDGTTHDLEYAELYNPTTHPINVGVTNAFYKTIMFGYSDSLGTRYDSSAFGAANQFYMTNVTTYIAPGHYYLIANASYFYINGAWIAADSYSDHALGDPLTYPDYFRSGVAGGVFMYYDWEHAFPSPFIDMVGWKSNSASPSYYEGLSIPDYGGANNGLGTPSGKQIVRVSSPGISTAMLQTYGRAYDTNSNSRDFLYDGTAYFDSFTTFISPKNHASGAHTTIAGKPPTVWSAAGPTYVSASDPNSGSTTAWTANITSGSLSLPYTRFQLAGVSTGTWTVAAAYLGYSNIYEDVVVTQGGHTGVPGAATSPAWPLAGYNHMQLTSTTASGFLKGTITNTAAAPIAGITVTGGGVSQITGSNGVYFMNVSSGVITVIANPNNDHASYVQGIAAPTVTAGAVVTQNFTLNAGGRITGYVTTGTTPLAFQAMTAVTGGGSQAGAAVTDASGNFTMRNIPTGSYTVSPVLESGQDASPNTLPAELTSAADNVFIGTFTVSGSFGSITGSVSDASGLVTSGALLLASTNTIASIPAAIVGSSAPAQTPIYMVSSKADGSYVLPVRGSANPYYLSAYVPVISGAGVTITTKTYSGIAVSASVATPFNVTIP